MRTWRVLVGPTDAAGVAGTISRAVRRRGHHTDLALFAAPRFGRPHHGVRGRAGRFAAGATAPLRFDVLHLQGGQSLVAGLLDARWAKVCRRLVLMHFWGSDCRQAAVMRRLHPARARTLALSEDARVAAVRAARTVPAAGRVSAAALVSDLELASYVVPHFRATYIVPTPIELPLDPAGPVEPLDGSGTVVLHAPSRRNLKGTDEIERALEEVGRELPLRPRLLGDVPHSKLLAELARADVVVDQLNSETTGVLALEAMALGKPVLCEFDRDKLAPFARGTPAVRVTPATLLDRLRDVCTDSELRAELGNRGTEFVRRVHDSNTVAALLGVVYDHARHGEPGVFEVTPGGIAPLETEF